MKMFGLVLGGEMKDGSLCPSQKHVQLFICVYLSDGKQCPLTLTKLVPQARSIQQALFINMNPFSICSNGEPFAQFGWYWYRCVLHQTGACVTQEAETIDARMTRFDDADVMNTFVKKHTECRQLFIVHWLHHRHHRHQQYGSFSLLFSILFPLPFQLSSNI